MARNSQARSSANQLSQQEGVKKSKSKSPTQERASLKLTKSVSGSRAKHHPKLSRLLKRDVWFLDTSEEDMPFLWAAYKKRKLDILDPAFKVDMQKEEFQSKLEQYIYDNNLSPVTFFTKIGGKDVAVGIGLFWIRGRVMQTENLIWFPWASKRIILENYVNFINNTRKTLHAGSNKPYVVLEFAMEKDKGFFDHVCSYGIMSRVGTSLELYEDGKCCVYESRSI